MLYPKLYLNSFLEGMTSWPRWIWISLSSTKRHIDIMGDPSSPSVAMGNLLSARFALLCLVAICCSQAFWMVPVKRFSTGVLFQRISDIFRCLNKIMLLFVSLANKYKSQGFCPSGGPYSYSGFLIQKI